MRIQYIETKVREVHEQIWRKKRHSGAPLISLLDPALAAELLGIDFEYQPDLGRFGQGGDRFEIAGALNLQEARIRVSTKFHPDTVRFTAAHELGHWMLHDFPAPHRDRPIKGLYSEQYQRPLHEREADYFAACFLMPPNLFRRDFELAFGITSPFVFTHGNALELSGGNEPDALLYPEDGSLVRELTLANAKSYQGRHFESLAKQYRVSDYSMAIRIRELRLIRD